MACALVEQAQGSTVWSTFIIIGYGNVATSGSNPNMHTICVIFGRWSIAFFAIGLCSSSDVTTTLVSPRVPQSDADGTLNAELSD